MEIKGICKDAELTTPTLEAATKKIDAACDVCDRNSPPKTGKKGSLKYINEDFNEEVQMDFTFHNIQNEMAILLLMTDTGTGVYGM